MPNDASIELGVVSREDAHALADLRAEAMRESLEAIGRFDPQRARDRFLATFDPAVTQWILVDGVRVGFLVVRPGRDDHLLLDHLYVRPKVQGAGVGSAVLRRVLAQADAAGQGVRVGALKGSRSNAFYARHGFELVERAEWDYYYVREASPFPPG